MPEWLRDPVWQSIGAFIGLLAILAVCTVAVWQRSRKVLRYSLSFAEIISGPIDPDFEVFYRGQPIENISSGTLTLFNAGNQPIRREDFDEPIGLKVTDGTLEFLTVQVVSTTPGNIPTGVMSITKTEFRLEPVLLNPGDQIELKILATKSGGVNIVGRIVGVSSIGAIDFRAKARTYALMTAASSVVAGLLGVYLLPRSLPSMEVSFRTLWALRIAALILLVGALVMVYEKALPIVHRLILRRYKSRE